MSDIIMDYQTALNLAKTTEWNVNHGGWIIDGEEGGNRLVLDTLNEGKSFRVCSFAEGKHVGKVIFEIPAPPEILFLLTDLRLDPSE